MLATAHTHYTRTEGRGLRGGGRLSNGFVTRLRPWAAATSPQAARSITPTLT